MERKGAERHRVLEELEHRGGSTPAAVRATAAATGVPEADVYGVATFYDLLAHPDVDVRVCQGLSCQIAGADALAKDLEAAGKRVRCVSCLGQCDRAPAALDAQMALVAPRPVGPVTPHDPELAIDLAGSEDTDYRALHRARAMGAEATLDAILASGLQGRGGAGFPAGIKWRAVRGQAETERHVVVNADEGEPGTFKDREVMKRRPHLMLEGLAIAALVVGAKTAWIYIRGEFPEPRRALEAAVHEAREHLGDLEIRFVDGHGAYICGEETALLEAIEGRRGMPRLKPPYPGEKGLWGLPTLVNNVETLACVPAIIHRGGAWFKALGRTEPGTKLYCISGHVERPGVYELPLGVSLDELVEAAGGYVGTPAAFTPGGASAGFLPMTYRSQPLDFRGLAAVGSMLGSAGVVVLNDTVDIAVATRNLLGFFEDESCGQCAPCRIGCRVLRQATDKYLDTGDPTALHHVADIAWEMEEGSICGLGVAAPLPLTSALKYFPDSFARRVE